MDIKDEPDDDEFVCDKCGGIMPLTLKCHICSEEFFAVCEDCCGCNTELTVDDILADIADHEYHVQKDME